MKTAMRDIAIRMNNAHVKFISDVQEQLALLNRKRRKSYAFSSKQKL